MTQIAARTFTPVVLLSLCITTFAAPKKAAKDSTIPAVLWADPADIATRDMINGPGGPQHQPMGPFKFVKEDMNGTSPKFIVTDADGVKWKVKLGEEVHSETAASRIVWAAGYFADEDYFLPDFKVDGMRPLKRGQKYVEPDGLTHNARFKRYIKGEEKAGIWKWKDNPFNGTRELNGLRVVMALINNWDLKDVNNAVYDADGRRIYLVSDLGATFATTRIGLSHKDSKGNLDGYEDSKFITRVEPPVVSFGTPGTPAFLEAVDVPDFKNRVNMEWIGKDIPIADAKWIGSILAKLSPKQIQDAFGAAGYSPKQIVGFSGVLEERIAELNKL